MLSSEWITDPYGRTELHHSSNTVGHTVSVCIRDVFHLNLMGPEGTTSTMVRQRCFTDAGKYLARARFHRSGGIPSVLH